MLLNWLEGMFKIVFLAYIDVRNNLINCYQAGIKLNSVFDISG